MVQSRSRWGIIGTGTISHSVVSDLKTCRGVEIVGVHSRVASNAARFAETHGIPRSTDNLDELLSLDTIDIVYIATPFALHFDHARRSLLAGKSVLVEKPMALNAEEVAELFTIATDTGLFLMEGMWMKFNPAFRRLLAEIDTGRIGEPRSLRATFAMPFPNDGGSRWDRERSGSTLLDQGIYPVTLAVTVFGEPETLYAHGSMRDDGLDLAEHFTLEYSDGRFAHGASGMTEFGDPSASVSGTRGWIALPALFWATTSIEIHADDWKTMIDTPERIELPKEGNGYVPMLDGVIAALEGGELQHPWHTSEDTLAVFRTMDRIRSAAFESTAS